MRTSMRVLGASARDRASQSPARDRALFHAGQVECTALTGASGIGRTILGVDAPYPHRLARRHHDYRIAAANPPREDRSGHDRTATCERKDTIYGRRNRP